LLVPGLRAFDVNYLALDPTDIPPDTTLNAVTREVRPQDRSGVVVRFPVKVSRGALLRLVDVAGAPLPVGSTATLQATGAAFPVGYDGEVYTEDLGPHNTLTVEREFGGPCFVRFDYQPVPGDLPTLGPLACKETP
jgi:outer membrane usher protein